MATIRSRGRGRWQVQVYVGRDPSTGARRFTARTVSGTKADARRAATALQTEVDAGRIGIHRDDLTVAQLVALWQAHKADDWAPKTREDQRRILARHALPHIGALRLDRLRPVDLDALYRQLRSAGVGVPTIRAVHRWLHAALATAVRWGHIATNPATMADPPKEKKGRGQAVSPDQARKVLAALDDDPFMAAYVRLSAATGARRGEVCALQWADVDLDAGLVTFRRALSQIKGEVIVKGLKASDEPNVVPIGSGTVAVLRRWRAMALEQDLVERSRCPWVFPLQTDRGRPVRPDRMSFLWREVRTSAGAPGLRLHDLRHGVATFGISQGFDPKTVSGRLGNSEAVVMEVYAHRVGAEDRRLADALDAALDA